MAHDLGALKKNDLARITADTTVQPKNVTHLTDAELMLKAIEQLAKLARAHGLPLRQSYVRVAKAPSSVNHPYTTISCERNTRRYWILWLSDTDECFDVIP